MALRDYVDDRLTAGNHLILAAGIAEPSRATLIDNRNGLGAITPGSLFAAPEHYSGFWIIKVDDLETAKQLAAEGSAACNRKTELRPLHG